MKSFDESSLKISTMTITASLNVFVDLDVLYNSIDIADENTDGFTYAEYGKKNEPNIFCKGFHKKLTIARRKKKIGKRFDNQITVIIKNKVDNIIESTNIKIFKNGNLQLAGVKNETHGSKVLNFVVAFFQEQSLKNQIVDFIENIKITNYKIQLINSDFRVGFNIKREKLFKIIQNEYKNIYSSYEPCIYPGVKIQYTNDKKSTKKTTIAVFRSGCVIVTGAQKLEDTESAYNFIKQLLIDNKNNIEMNQLLSETNEDTTKIIKKIKQRNIILPEGYVLENHII